MSVRIRKKNLSYIFLIIYVFVFIFAPPILPSINIVIVLSMLSLIAILTRYRKDFILVLQYSGIYKFIKYFFLYVVYVSIVILINFFIGERVQFSNYITTYYQYFMVLPVSIICVIYLIIKGNRLELSKDQFLFLFIYASLIQLILVILSILFPTIKSFFIDIMYKNTGETLLLNTWVTHRRFNGFANNMLDLFGFSIGIFASLPFFLRKTYKKKKYLLLVPLISIISLMNARSGVIIIFVGFILYLLYSTKSTKKQLVANFRLFGIAMILSFGLLLFLNDIMPDTIAWVINDFLSFFGQSDNSVSNSLASVYFSDQFWNLPSFEYILIGTGHTLYGIKGMSSDIGYINELWRSGLCGLILLSIIFLSMLNTVKREHVRCYRYLISFLLMSFIIFNFKANALSYNGGFVSIIVIVYYFSYKNYFN